jgi:uroporphyrinogen-III synthase
MTHPKIPMLLLKTKSVPNDGYEEYFSEPESRFTPIFVPVLEHKPHTANLDQLRSLLRKGELKGKYGGMIFTSQRAVEGFARVAQELEQDIRPEIVEELKEMYRDDEESDDNVEHSMAHQITSLLPYALSPAA